MTTENQDLDQSNDEEQLHSEFENAGEVSTSPKKKDKREAQDNSGSLFKNDRKSKESHPDITGNATISGTEFYVSGWRKSGQKGDFYSLSFKAKDTAAAASSDLI